MPPSSSASQPAALEEAFDGVKQALSAERKEGEAYFTRDARSDLAKVFGVARHFQSNAALGRRIIAQLESVQDAHETQEVHFNIYAGRVKSVAFLCHSIQWLEKRAEETEKEESLGPPLPLDDFADALNRADQIL